MENFDLRIERFLKKELTPEEEANLLAELNSNVELLKRAKTLALMIRTMQELRMQSDEALVKEIASTNEEEYQEAIWSYDRLVHFDNLTERFLKKQLTPEEEAQYIDKLEQIPELKKRAQLVALAVNEMDGLYKERSKELIDRIGQQSELSFRRVAQLPDASNSSSEDVAQKPEASSTSSHSSIKWRRVVRYAAAACVVAVFGWGGYRYYQYEQTLSLGQEYFMPQSYVGVDRGMADEAGDQLQRLFQQVGEGKDIPHVINELNKYYQLTQGEEYNDYSPYAVDIAWNLAIAYLKDNQREQALIVLHQIVETNEGKAIADKANELIRKIESI